MFAGLFSKRDRRADDRADAIYATIVAAARRPELYRDFGAPDTLPGRFELVVLHAALVFRRLRRGDDPAAEALGQEIFDAMFRTLDANLRELGVGDMAVPKRIKAMARSFYDGAKRYDEALDAGDEEMLAEAIGRTIFGAPPEEPARRLAAYARLSDEALSRQTFERIAGAGPEFPPLAGAAS